MKRRMIPGIIILITLIFAGIAYSDFGSFSGNSDYSSSRSSSSSSSSGGGGFSGGDDWFDSSSSTRTRTRRTVPEYGNAPEYGTGINPGVVAGVRPRSGFMDSDDDDSFDECGGVAFVLLVFFVFWFMIHRNSKKDKEKRNIIGIQETVRTLRPMNEYLELDPQFDEERIRTLMSNLYVQMQETWQKKDISSLRPYMTDKFFSQMDNQLEQFRRLGRTDYTERIAVLNTGLIGWRQSAGMDYITVSLNSRIVSYVLDDRTGELISGDRKREKFMEYEIELCRKSGTITSPESDGVKSATCPHCGAPLKLNASAKCEYCGSVITAVNSEWAICGMRGISQRTV